MLVLVSFVLVLAAAVTLVVGLLQSGLTLIYLSIACSVLAGVVLAVAVLRGRPEPRPAAAGGRAFTPPQRAQVPASVGASPTETTSSWSSPPVSSAPPPPPPPAPPAPVGEDLATRAAGSALLGRLRGRRAEQEAATADAATPATAAPVAEPVAEPAAPEPAGSATAVMPSPVAPAEGPDGFPIEDYDRLRATELLAMLPGLDRNQLEAVRSRESSGKNRFTIMSRVDALLASKEEPAWEAGDDDWEDGVGTDAESEAVAIESEAVREEPGFGDALDAEEGDAVDELVSPAPAAASGAFPIAGYETLTVGQILPRLSELDADELAQVRAREQQGRNRGTVLDRIDRLSARAGASPGAMAMPAATPPARKSTARKAPAAAAKKSPASRATKAAAPAPPAPPAKATKATTTAKAAKAPLPVPAAPATPAKATRRSPAKKAAVAPVVPATKAVRKSPAAKAAPAPAKASMKDAVKKARGTKKS